MNSASGHRETIKKLPEPLQSEGFFGIGTWAPPAALLSAASIVVFTVVLVFLQRNAQLRALFRLDLGALCPEPSLCAIAVTVLTALLAWVIVLICRRRPGPVWPRLWALFLALLATVVTIGLCIGMPPTLMSLLHAVAMACFAATLTLTPRLLPLQPDSPWVQRIAPWSLLFVLVVVLPFTYSMGRATVADQAMWLQGRVVDLRRQLKDLQGCSKTGRGCSESKYRDGMRTLVEVVNNQPLWDSADTLNRRPELTRTAGELLDSVVTGLSSRLSWQLQQIKGSVYNDSTDPAKVGQGVEQLSRLHFSELYELLPLAVKLDKIQTVEQAHEKLVDTVVASLDPAGTPKLTMPPVNYTRDDGPWDLNPNFPAASRRVVEYHQQISRLFKELEEITAKAADEPALASLQDYYRRKRQQEWENRLQAMAGSWAEYWLVPFMEQEPQAEMSEPSLAAVLAMPVIGNLAAANLAKLLEISKGQADNFLSTRQASNCQAISYLKENEKKYYFSVQCRAYAPGSTPEQTQLRVELRLVYEAGRPPASSDKPDRIYFIFPVPSHKEATVFKNEVESALREAQSAAGDTPRKLSTSVNLEAFTQEQQYVELVIRR
ncbi:MAG: hypothetical protein U1F76_06610 [Candidatus Competibacteraceae bacterium]